MSNQAVFSVNRAIGSLKDCMDGLHQSVFFTATWNEDASKQYILQVEEALNTARLLMHQAESIRRFAGQRRWLDEK